jgi:predicted MFS family arabinose efflux permease
MFQTISMTNDLQRNLRRGLFLMEGMNAMASGYYFTYLFFYMQKNFAFGERENMLLTMVYGFCYMVSAYSAGRLGHKYGYFRLLAVGFSGMAAMLVAGGLAAQFLGISSATKIIETIVLGVWTLSACLTWPTLQSLLKEGQAPSELPRTAGHYNMVWACSASFAVLTGGAIMQWLGETAFFWVPLGIHAVQLCILPRVHRLSLQCGESAAVATPVPEVTAEMNPRPIAKARMFLLLAWLANPFAYVAIYGLIPIVPQLSEKLGLTTAQAGAVFSIWQWVRLGAFVLFWLWPGWHYKFRWMLAAFLAMIASFAVILLSAQVWLIVVAQLVFGLSVGLIYFSSLFYSLDVGESKGKEGGFHEAAIGLGTFLAPTAAFAGLQFSRGNIDAMIGSISGLLVFGLILFLLMQWRARHKIAS